MIRKSETFSISGVEVIYRVVSGQDFELKTDVTLPSQTISGGLKFKLQSDELNFAVTMADYKLELNGKRDGDTITGNLNDLSFEIEMGNPEYELELNGVVPFINYPIEFEVEYEEGHGFKFNLKADDDLILSFVLTKDNQLYQAEVSVKFGDSEGRSAQILIETGDQGKAEITITGLNSHSLQLQFDSRVRRAIFQSETMGNYAFEMDQDTLKGILVLTTPHVCPFTIYKFQILKPFSFQGTHKLTYDMDVGQYSLTLKLDSPWIQNGHATVNAIFNTPKNQYGIRATLGEQHFLRYVISLQHAML